MMKTVDPIERQEIINEAVEKAILALPDIMGNLIMSHIQSIKLNKAFYDKFPDFKNDKELVVAVIEKLENDNPGVDYQKLLDQAAPLIREQLGKIKNLDLKTVTKPSRDLSRLNISNNGEL